MLGIDGELMKAMKGHCSSHLGGKLGQVSAVVEVAEVGPPESRTLSHLSPSLSYSFG